MFAIFKKELSLYYLTPFGYVFTGLFLLISGIVFIIYNLFGGKSDLYGMFGVLNFISIFLFPVLTMKLLSDEKRNSTDQLLFTLPVTMASIVLGKYFAALFVFFITLLTTVVFAVFISIFGNASPGSITGSYLGFFLLGAAYIGICFFGAALSDNQITSVLLSFGLLAGFLLIGFLSRAIPVKVIKDILNWFALINRYDDPGAGILKIGTLVYYAGYVAVSVVLSIVILDNKRQYRGMKPALKRFFKKNGFSNPMNKLVKIVLIFGIVVIANLIAGELPWSYDMTMDRIFSLSEQSGKIAGSLEKPVNIIVLAQADKQNRLLNLLLKEYKKAGKGKIKLEYLDADKNPVAVKKYDINNEGLANGSVIVECRGRIKRIHDFEIIKQNNFGVGRIFEGEAQISGAILYVTGDKFRKVYFLEGHDETALETDLYKLGKKMENEAHIAASLNLLKQAALPDDMDALVVVSPKRDLSSGEKLKLEEYLDKGGRVMFLLDIVNPDTDISGFYNLLNKYGVLVENNFVVEEDAGSYFSNNKMYVIPDFKSNAITGKLKSKNLYMMLPFPGNINIASDVDENIVIEPVLTSSEKSWIRTDLMDAAPNKGTDDIAGPANLAVSVVRDNTDTKYKRTKMVIVYNGRFITDDVIDMQANYDFFMNALSWLEDREESISIRPKLIGADIMMIRGSQYWALMLVTLFLLPLIIFCLGFIVWRIRKNI